MSLNGDTPTIAALTDADELPRCRVCGHLITSPASVAAGIGQTCRRRLRRALIDAEPEVVAAVFAALAVLSCGEVA